MYIWINGSRGQIIESNIEFTQKVRKKTTTFPNLLIVIPVIAVAPLPGPGPEGPDLGPGPYGPHVR